MMGRLKMCKSVSMKYGHQLYEDNEDYEHANDFLTHNRFFCKHIYNCATYYCVISFINIFYRSENCYFWQKFDDDNNTSFPGIASKGRFS